MTVVHAQIMRPDATGTLKPARGYLRWTPVGHYSAPGTALVLPLPFRVKLVDGVASATVAPSTADWAWEVTYELSGREHASKVYAVPDSVAPVELSALTEVAPLTGTAVPPPPPSWQAAIDAALGTALATAVGNALQGALDAALEDALGTSLDTAVATAVAAAVTPAVTAAVTPAVSSAVSAALADAPRTVTVSAGDEARPATTGSVSWIGGTVRPVHMADGDLWFKALP